EIAGGLVGGDTSSAGNAAEAGKTTVENNHLSPEKNKARSEEFAKCNGDDSCRAGVRDTYRKEYDKVQEQINNCSSPDQCVAVAKELKEWQKIYSERAKELQDKAHNNGGIGALTDAEQKEWAEIRGTLPNLEGSRNLAIYRAEQLGGSAETTKERDLAMAAAGIGAGIGSGKGNNQASISTEQKIVEVKSGSKGDWNKQLNKPEPNTTYKVDDNKIFQTDSLGRTSLAEGSLSLNKNDRNTYQQCKTGKCGNGKDEGGHLFASILNGPGEKINMVPMDGTLNKSGWKKMENAWVRALKENKEVYVKIEPVYKGNSARPESFNVTYTIDGGRPIVKDISNIPDGGKK
uniref:DNA/RNA non-specific endonuclease n=2 Tax=unclassified Providencia TaxID=2633465 RepID=UPI00234B2D64